MSQPEWCYMNSMRLAISPDVHNNQEVLEACQRQAHNEGAEAREVRFHRMVYNLIETARKIVAADLNPGFAERLFTA